jgi:predicted dehydrogenase
LPSVKSGTGWFVKSRFVLRIFDSPLPGKTGKRQVMKDQLLRGRAPEFSRRRFLKQSSVAAAGATMAANFPFVLTGAAAPDDPIRVGLIGCGGRGTGAVGDVLKAAPNVQVVALADLFGDRLANCRNELKKLNVAVRDDHCFTGFDAYRKVCGIEEINYVIMATSPHFRPIHLRAAVEANKHAFIEKPVAVDGPGVRSVIESGRLARQKKLAIVAGTQRRHSNDYRETIRRLRDGAIADLLVGRAYYNTGTLWHRGRKPEWTEMEYECRNWYYFTWLSGDHIVEQHIHNLDTMNWVFNGHPAKASGSGGRQARTDAKWGHIYDHFAVEFEYPGGARVFSFCRQTDGAEGNVSDSVIGAIGSSNCRNLIQAKGEKPWRFDEKPAVGQVQEHTDMIQSIREGNPLNEAERIAESTLTAIMGREAAYSGQAVEWEAALNSTKSLAPKNYEFDAEPPNSEVAIPGRYRFT